MRATVFALLRKPCRARLTYAAAALLVLTTTTQGHHSTLGDYDGGSSVRISGTLVSIAWSNPHVFMVLEAKPEGGVLEHWTVEAQSPSRLRQWDAEFEIGEDYTMRVSPARSGAPAGFLRAAMMPDGRVICPGDRPGNRGVDCDV